MAAIGSWCCESEDKRSSKNATGARAPTQGAAEPAPPGRQRRPLGSDAEGRREGYFAVGFLFKKSGMLNFSGTPILLLM